MASCNGRCSESLQVATHEKVTDAAFYVEIPRFERSVSVLSMFEVCVLLGERQQAARQVSCSVEMLHAKMNWTWFEFKYDFLAFDCMKQIADFVKLFPWASRTVGDMTIDIFDGMTVQKIVIAQVQAVKSGTHVACSLSGKRLWDNSTQRTVLRYKALALREDLDSAAHLIPYIILLSGDNSSKLNLKAHFNLPWNTVACVGESPSDENAFFRGIVHGIFGNPRLDIYFGTGFVKDRVHMTVLSVNTNENLPKGRMDGYLLMYVDSFPCFRQDFATPLVELLESAFSNLDWPRLNFRKPSTGKGNPFIREPVHNFLWRVSLHELGDLEEEMSPQCPMVFVVNVSTGADGLFPPVLTLARAFSEGLSHLCRNIFADEEDDVLSLLSLYASRILHRTRSGGLSLENSSGRGGTEQVRRTIFKRLATIKKEKIDNC